jgi:hypothetical protein
MKIRISKQRLKFGIIFVSLTLIFAILVYFFFPFPVTEWRYGTAVLKFRVDLRKANEIQALPSCSEIHETFNSRFMHNITIYFQNNSASNVNDYALFAVETAELTYKMTRYFLEQKRIVGIDTQPWNVPGADPLGSVRHPRIYLLSPSTSQTNQVELRNWTLQITGRNLREFDLATAKALICILGIKL